MCLGTMRRAACQMIGSARRAGARVIAAGPDVSDAPAPYLQAGADVTLVGEGLSALLDLLARLDVHPNASAADLACGLSGVSVLRQDKIVTTSGARVLRSADYEGSAAWDLVDMDRYRSVWMKAHGYFSLNMAASRGCSFRCAWCAKPIWGNHISAARCGRGRSGNGVSEAHVSIRSTSGLPTTSSDSASTGSRTSPAPPLPRAAPCHSPSRLART